MATMTKKIDSLTPQQELDMIECRNQWVEIGLCILAADRPKAEAAITQIYAVLGKAAPRFIWADSPISANIIIGLLSANKGASVRDSVYDSVGASVWASVRDSVWDAVGDAVWASVGDAVWDAVRDAVWDAVRDSVWYAVRDWVWASVRASVGDADMQVVGAYQCGQHDAAWLSFYDFMRSIGVKYDTENDRQLRLFEDLARSCMWWYPYENVCVVCERPKTIHRDQFGKPHHETGMAIEFRDGWGVYMLQGIRVPADIITDRSSLTVHRIKSEGNAELRRVMIDLYGNEKYIDDAGLKLIHEDIYGKLYQEQDVTDQPYTAVKVVNGTPEPDGSYKTYVLDVHPELRPMFGNGRFGNPQKLTALNAVASTYSMTGEQYKAGLVCRR